MKRLSRKNQIAIGFLLLAEYCALGFIAYQFGNFKGIQHLLAILLLTNILVLKLLFMVKDFYYSFRKNLIYHSISQTIIISLFVVLMVFF